jgi:hypothetical protein
VCVTIDVVVDVLIGVPIDASAAQCGTTRRLPAGDREAGLVNMADRARDSPKAGSRPTAMALSH